MKFKGYEDIPDAIPFFRKLFLQVYFFFILNILVQMNMDSVVFDKTKKIKAKKTPSDSYSQRNRKMYTKKLNRKSL